MKLFIGLLSGTSMDGIDAALVDLDSNSLLYSITYSYSEKLYNLLKNIKILDLGYLAKLNRLLGEEFAQAVLNLLKNSLVDFRAIKAIGSHGQTIVHHPKGDFPYSFQLGCAHTIAELTNICVVSDFRTRDLVLGGQGAPLAPLLHQQIFQKLFNPLMVINIGGIANLTVINNHEILGYDVGPGNCLLDLWIQKNCNIAYDDGGEWAKTGTIIFELLNNLLQDEYFSRNFPKSIGKEYFSLMWIEQYLSPSYKAEDVQATLQRLTTILLFYAINSHKLKLTNILICGGGVHNKALISDLAKLLPHLKIESTINYGICPDFMEAMLFAWLAEKTLNNKPVNLTTITGARKAAILGVIYPASVSKSENG